MRVFFHIRGRLCGQGHPGVVNQKTAFPIRRLGDPPWGELGAKAQFARGEAAHRLCHPTRLTLLSVLHRAPRAAPGAAALALAEPVATLPSRRARKARLQAMMIRRCAISAQIVAISRTATPQNQSGAQTSESRIEDKVMGTPRHGLDMRPTSPFNRPAEWVDLSRRGWHERATYLMARVP
jgi:hypothetical protein